MSNVSRNKRLRDKQDSIRINEHLCDSSMTANSTTDVMYKSFV